MQAVSDIRFAIQRDWMRVDKGHAGIVAESGLPATWFRGRDSTLKLKDFVERWCHRGVLCAVNAAGAQGRPTLCLKLHRAWATVPVPGAAVVAGV
jgi:hypothetical protein